MRVARVPEELPPEATGAVVALGVFDGVHLGHRAVLLRAVARAGELGVAAAVVTFDVHPDCVLSGARPDFLTSLEHRLRLIAQLGVACALVLTFDRNLAQMSAQDFARWAFHDAFCARAVVIGRGSRFGRGAEGTPELLALWGRPWGLVVEVVEPVVVAGAPVSSTRIRQAVRRRHLEEAEMLLGRPFSVLGTVVRGEGRGKRLGFPTANLNLHHEACPPEGVYVGRASLDTEAYPAAVSVGRKPTFARDTDLRAEPAVEVHLLDFSGDILGRTLEVAFLAWLRGQERFPDGGALAKQMLRDASKVRDFFAQEKPLGRKP
jgi:riboflavin kinase/FMN adenylyltransferase